MTIKIFPLQIWKLLINSQNKKFKNSKETINKFNHKNKSKAIKMFKRRQDTQYSEKQICSLMTKRKMNLWMSWIQLKSF